MDSPKKCWNCKHPLFDLKVGVVLMIPTSNMPESTIAYELRLDEKCDKCGKLNTILKI
jgi:hypothetical protein